MEFNSLLKERYSTQSTSFLTEDFIRDQLRTPSCWQIWMEFDIMLPVLPSQSLWMLTLSNLFRLVLNFWRTFSNYNFSSSGLNLFASKSICLGTTIVQFEWMLTSNCSIKKTLSFNAQNHPLKPVHDHLWKFNFKVTNHQSIHCVYYSQCAHWALHLFTVWSACIEGTR